MFFTTRRLHLFICIPFTNDTIQNKASGQLEAEPGIDLEKDYLAKLKQLP